MSGARSLTLPDLKRGAFAWREKLADLVPLAFTLFPLAILIFILGKIFLAGRSVINWEFLTAAPIEGMTEGGIFPCIFKCGLYDKLFPLFHGI